MENNFIQEEYNDCSSLEIAGTESQLEQEYENGKSWGLATGINLHSCNPDLVKDEKAIKDFVVDLCDLIQMKRFGECVVVNFGEDPKVSGFSMTQLIETSLISGHFVNSTNDIYLDIFSCKFYKPSVVVEFAKKFFEAKDYTYYFRIRK